MLKHSLPALVTVFALGVTGLISVWCQQPILVPSLGSAIFIQALTPHEPSARVWNMTLGQLLGVGGGLLGVFIAHAAHDPKLMNHHSLVLDRVAAVVVAALITLILQQLCKAVNPAGGATAVIIAIGAEMPNWAGTLRLAAGIAVITVLGEIGRRIILSREDSGAAR